MGKKVSSPDTSTSILLTVPEGVAHQAASQAFLQDHSPETQAVFFNAEEETVSIGLVREILRHAGYARAANEPQTIIVCAVQSATIPAQNALLKIVEEPPANSQIILVARSGQQLLPTLISRCREILWTQAQAAETAAEAQSTEQQEAIQQLNNFLDNPADSSYHELIDLAQLLKDRTIAKHSLWQALTERSKKDSPALPLLRRTVLSALDSLEKNGNVRLVLEHCFFMIRKDALSKK